MQRVKFVPANAEARATNPLAVLELDMKGGERAKVMFALAALRGWRPLSSLSCGARARWIEAHRKAKADADRGERKADLPA